MSTNGIITTVAGNLNNGGGYSGDGGAATNAGLSLPLGVAVDASGNLFIADYNNNCIRQVSTNGIITTVAGNGNGGYPGDGGTASNAELYYPTDVPFDASGNLFISDGGNERIREVTYLHFCDRSTISLPNINTNNMGNYTVIVSNPSGSVTRQSPL